MTKSFGYLLTDRGKLAVAASVVLRVMRAGVGMEVRWFRARRIRCGSTARWGSARVSRAARTSRESGTPAGPRYGRVATNRIRLTCGPGVPLSVRGARGGLDSPEPHGPDAWAVAPRLVAEAASLYGRIPGHPLCGR